LYPSTDSGTSFTKVLSGTISPMLKAVGFGKAATGASYMAIYMYGTVHGTKAVYRSDDAGATWIKNRRCPASVWMGREMHYRRSADLRTCILATNGFGIDIW